MSNEKERWAEMTDEQFAVAAEAAPGAALAYAASRLTDAQFAVAAEDAPEAALAYAAGRYAALKKKAMTVFPRGEDGVPCCWRRH